MSISLSLHHFGRCFESATGTIQAVEDVSFHVEPGAFLALVGPSGCGKSTILRAIAGLDTEYSGEVQVNEISIRGPDLSRGIIFQEPRLFPWLTTTENIGFGLRLSGQQRARRIQELIELVELEGFERAYPHQLSGGMAQRGPIKTIQDLKGKKIGGPSGKNDTFPLLVLQRAGIKETEVEWLKLENDVGRSALRTGAIDAWRTWDPFYANVQAAKEAVPLVDGMSYIQNYVALFGRTDYISSYPDTVKRFITTYKQALDYVKSDHTEAVDLFVQQNKLSSQVAELTLSRRSYAIQAPTQDYLADLAQQSKLLKQFGVLKKEPDWSKAVNTTLAQQVLGS